MRLILVIAVIMIIVRLCTWGSRPYHRGVWFGPMWYTPMPRWPRGPYGPRGPHGPGPGGFGRGPGGFGHGPGGFGGGGHGFGGGGRR